jgi:hypothetical protein
LSVIERAGKQLPIFNNNARFVSVMLIARESGAGRAGQRNGDYPPGRLPELRAFIATDLRAPAKAYHPGIEQESVGMIDQELRAELLAMKAEDEQLHTQLSNADALTGHYVPALQTVHEKNAARLREIVSEHGWPDEGIADTDGAYAAWLIVQHGIGNPGLQKEILPLLQKEAAQSRIPAWHAAYLEDRIAMYEQRPQRYGTQWLDDPQDGRTRPWPIEEPEKVDSRRAGVGLGPLRAIPERGPDLPAKEQQTRRENQRWWQDWLVSRGWRSGTAPEPISEGDHVRTPRQNDIEKT